jgi:hypothetical protein
MAGVICGLSCRAYTFPFSRLQAQLSTSSLSSFGKDLKTIEGKYREYDVTDDIKYTPERGAFFDGLSKISITSALLIRQRSHFSDGQVQTELDTTSCERRLIPDSEMQYPTRGYRKTTVVEDVAQTEYSRDNLKELFDSVSEFGDTSAAPRKK